MTLTQTPAPGQNLLRHSGDSITFTLTVDHAVGGRAVLRTSLGGAKRRRRELIESMDSDRPALPLDWNDLPMERRPSTDGKLHFAVRMPLIDIGFFRAKCCFFPQGSNVALWPEGPDVCVKVEPAWTCRWSSIYCAFPRQFGEDCTRERSRADSADVRRLDDEGFTVIPPSGTFRSLIEHLDTILFEERFRIIQLLPVHPCPTTFARMGRYGSPFAGTDFMTVDPSLAEFDTGATPMDQFRELVDAVHTRGARIFIDLPANHTGWASVLQTHHPEWFRKDGKRFHSPGAWGVVWEDLVELDYAQQGLRSFMASVFEFWCAQGVDGFRCDAGYMIPAETWLYITARVREQFPDTVFLLEGLGGKISVTRDLISNQGLNWAYSEIFQTEDRSAFEHYLPGAQDMSETVGPLAHYAETHDNNRLAARSPAYAKMRTALAALSSAQGCFGITNGVEWFATEKVDVHRASAIRWGAAENQVGAIRRLNTILATLPAWGPGTTVRMVQHGGGNVLALLRAPAPHSPEGNGALILVNLDPDNAQTVEWNAPAFRRASACCIFDAAAPEGAPSPATTPPALTSPLRLLPGQMLCYVLDADAPAVLRDALAASPGVFRPESVRQQELRMAVLRIRRVLTHRRPLHLDEDVDELARALSADPLAVVRRFLPDADTMPPVTTCEYPRDTHRVVPLPYGNLLLVKAPAPFRARLVYTDEASGRLIRKSAASFPLADGSAAAFIDHPMGDAPADYQATLHLEIAEPGRPLRTEVQLQVLPRTTSAQPAIRHAFSGMEVLRHDFVALLTNGTGAMAHVRARWPDVRSQYDALLAANPDPAVPCDRQVLFTRCRAWLVNQGFSNELDASCLRTFESTREEARWLFAVPAGTGRTVPVEATLRLARGLNRVQLRFRRMPVSGDPNTLENGEAVQLILRPDVESRSFHTKTKAFAGPESAYPASVRPADDGFCFTPPGATSLDIRGAQLAADGSELARARYTQEPEWHYMVPNPAEAARGQDGSNDLYSPGWFSAMLSGGESLCLTASMPGELRPVETPAVTPPSAHESTLRGALSAALRDYIVRREGNATVIAGYPWFLDWGRDTFIVLRGMIADGLTDHALSIIRTFGAFEQDGTLPNMICGADASNRDTSDAQLWYITAVADLCEKLGRETVLDMVCTPSKKTVRTVLRSIVEGYRRGTPNGIRMDERSGLVYSPSHYTWMDTNFPAGTPRQGYPVEIQALWIHALSFVATIDPEGPWAHLAQLARNSLLTLFRKPGRLHLSDCLHADGFCPAALAHADDHLRCNQLFAVTLGAVTDPETVRGILVSSETLLVPGAIRTLAPDRTAYGLPIYGPTGLLNDPHSPYWGRYEGDEDTRRKPAYHNGTAWGWPFPSYAEALYKTYGNSALEAARSLIASAAPWLESDCIGHLPEICDGDAPHTGRGCDAQAWSVSEFLRLAHILGL